MGMSARQLVELEATNESSALDFNPYALREKCRQEREKRLWPEGVAQYIEVKDDSAATRKPDQRERE